MWPMLAIAGGSALLGHMQAKQQQKEQLAQNLAAAEQTRQSPWTGMGQGQLKTGAGSPVLAGLGAGLQGGMAGYQLQQGMKADARAQQTQNLLDQKTQAEIDQMQREQMSSRPSLYRGSSWNIA